MIEDLIIYAFVSIAVMVAAYLYTCYIWMP